MSACFGGSQRWAKAAARAVWRDRMERLVQELTERPETSIQHDRWLLERVKAKMVKERVKWMVEFATKKEMKKPISREALVDFLVKRCGSAVHLVPDTLLLARDILHYNAPSQQAGVTLMEVRDADSLPIQNALMTALQDPDADFAVQCPHCQPDHPLRIICANRSGSSAEGLADMVIGKRGTSDFDIMYEIGGPFTWAARPVAAKPPNRITPQAAPQLWARPTRNAGFVTLHWVPTNRCKHDAPLGALPADSIRRLMGRLCRVLKLGKITVAGPATNNVWSGDISDGGTDHVPCLRLPGWWPAEEEFVNRHRQADFPPAAVRDDIGRYGVHLVPTGRPGSETEAIEWRLSFSRAEVVAAHHLSAVQHATITAVKQMKKRAEDMIQSTKMQCTLKSYFIKTAGLWLAQDKPSGTWASVTDGVRWVLDWLEQHLSIGTLPCFFWDDINIAAELSQDQLKAIINTVQLMRREINRLLMASCMNWISLDSLLEDGTEPLTERQLRHRLARLLVIDAVIAGTLYRHDAPCWEHWMRCVVPVLARASQDRLFQWLLRKQSGTYQQQCRLLQAWIVVDKADLAGGTQLPPSHGDVTLDVTPLIALLTEADLVHLLGDPAAVAAWWNQQLQLPPEQRPAGLTAELDTPRGRAELLLQPELLLRAIREAVPRELNYWESLDKEVCEDGKKMFRPPRTLRWLQAAVEQLVRGDLEARIRHQLPADDGLPIAATARLWRQNMQLLLSGDRLRTAYEAARTRWPDRWQLLQHLVQEHTLEEEATSGDSGGTVNGEERRGADEEWRGADEERCGADEERRGADERRRGADEERRGADEERRGADEERRCADDGRCGADEERRGADDGRRGADEERRQLREWQVLERQSMDQRHAEERGSMDRRQLDERRSMEQRHVGERRSMGQRYLDERRILEQQYLHSRCWTK